jgi:circadian clock protein KaiC
MLSSNHFYLPEFMNFPSTLALAKSRSGIPGLDEVTGGGLPTGRPTLICGAAGAGKTLFAMSFLVAGATQFNEPGVFMSFEETEDELRSNVASLGYDLTALIAEKKLAIDYVHLERSEIQETGEYDLDGLFVRLGYAIKTTGAKRVVLDTLEALFAGLSDTGILRAELRRLFRWLKDQGVTAMITGEKGEGSLTRHGLEEYVSDCVILLDHRVIEQVATRRLRVVKYRGSSHGTNEYPFLIDTDGITVLPVTSLQLGHDVSDERVSTGIAHLDEMMGGKGFYRGSSILVSGTAGTGKSTLAAHFIDAACRRGERCLYFAFEESPQQIMRNMRSVGLDLGQWVEKDLLRFSASRPSLWGLEMHLARMHKEVDRFKPQIVVIDPIYNLSAVGTSNELHSMLLRLIDFLKMQAVTGMFISLDSNQASDNDESKVSSLMDTWLQLRNIEYSSERNRGLYILKSRGMQHSNQIREFLLTDKGIRLRDVYLGSGGVLTGSARLAQEAKEAKAQLEQQEAIERRMRESARKRQLLQQQIAALTAELDSQDEDLARLMRQQTSAGEAACTLQEQLAASRGIGGKQ